MKTNIPAVLIALAGLSAMSAAAMAQTRASFPMTGMPSYRTATPTPLSPRPPSGAQPVVTRAPVFISQPIVGTGGFVTRGVISSGSGLRVSGDFQDDNFRLSFHLGSDFGAKHVVRTPNVIVWPHVGSPFWFYNDCDRFGRRTNRFSTIDGALVQVQPVSHPAPPQPEAPPPPPPTLMEQAATHLRTGHNEQAQTSFQQRLEEDPEDANAMRGLAIAFLRLGELSQAEAMFGLAYRKQPSLCEQPMRAGEWWASATDLRRDLVRFVTHANRTESGAALLGVAALMQAQGRKDHALRMANRAKAKGLDETLATRLIESLTRP